MRRRLSFPPSRTSRGPPTVRARAGPTPLAETLEALANFAGRHRGETIVVCGCGPSLNDLPVRPACPTIGVNDVGRNFDPDYLVVVNPPAQFPPHRRRPIEESRARAVFTQYSDWRLEHARRVPVTFGAYGGVDFSNPNVLHYTRNSPYVALCLAVHLGATRIGLIGVDFTDNHFFGATGVHPLAGSLTQINAEYLRLREACIARGVEVVNLSPVSRLTAFPRADLAKFLRAERTAQRPTNALRIVSYATTPIADRPTVAAAKPRLFFVHYRFLSCGEVFTDGLRHATEELELTAEHVYWDDPRLPEKISLFAPDLLWVVHGRNFVQRWGAQFSRYRSAVWLLDEPYEVDDTASFSQHFSAVFLNDPATLSRHRNGHYLPACYDARVHFPNWGKRQHRVGFIGSGNPTRERFLAALAERGLLTYLVGGPWRDSRLQALCLAPNIPAARTAELYRDTAVVLNVFRDQHHFNRACTVATSMNPRIYEALACGALVVSEVRAEIDELLPMLPTFRNLDEAAAQVGHFLSDPVAREHRRHACFAFLRHDTYTDRLRSALEILLRTPAIAPTAYAHRSTSPAGAASHSAEFELLDSVPLPDVVRSFDEKWEDFGRVASRDGAGDIIIEASSFVHAGAERGLVGRYRYRAVDLEFEVWITAQAVFLAKVQQQDRLDQTTNSYHVLCDAQQAYVARHNHIFGMIPLARETWQRVRLRSASGQVSVYVEGVLAHRFEDSMMEGGHVFLGAKGGTVHLRRIRLTEPGDAATEDGLQKDQVNQPADAGGTATATISYCIAVLRPIYARMLLQDLIKKTSVPYEILIWLNVEDAELEAFLDDLTRDGRPLRIIGRSPENLGMLAYRSLFAAAHYELITQIDDDVLHICPEIAERATTIFRSFPRVRQIVADVWRDEFTTGARPPIQLYHPIDSDSGLYNGPIDGWFSIYHRSILPHLLTIPYSLYCCIGGTVRQRLIRTGLQALLCTRMRVFHATGPEYASYFGVLDFEIAKYRRLGRHDIVKWYEEASLPSHAVLERNVVQIKASLTTAGPWQEAT